MPFFMVLWWMTYSDHAHWHRQVSKWPFIFRLFTMWDLNGFLGGAGLRSGTAEERPRPGGGSGFLRGNGHENCENPGVAHVWIDQCWCVSWMWKNKYKHTKAKCDDFIDVKKLACTCLHTLFGREYWNDTNTTPRRIQLLFKVWIRNAPAWPLPLCH